MLMKTTLYLNSELIRAAKEHALKNGISLTKLIELSVRDYLDAANIPKVPHELNLYTKECGSEMDAIVADRKKLYDLMEKED